MVDVRKNTEDGTDLANSFLEFNGKPTDDTYNYPNPYEQKGDKKGKTVTEEEEKIDLSDVPLDKAYQGNKFEDDNTDFVVENPVTKSGHVEYMVRGVDKNGAFDGIRRYNEFYCLH